MSSVCEIIDLYRNQGLDECVKYVSKQIEKGEGKVTSCGEVRRLVASIVAKYNNLCKHKHNASAAKELETFLQSSIRSPTVAEQENTTANHNGRNLKINNLYSFGEQG